MQIFPKIVQNIFEQHIASLFGRLKGDVKIVAVCDGVVTKVASVIRPNGEVSQNDYEIHIKLNGSEFHSMTIGHVQEVEDYVRVGYPIEEGDTIGWFKESLFPTYYAGPHVHMGVYIDLRTAVDPFASPWNSNTNLWSVYNKPACF